MSAREVKRIPVIEWSPRGVQALSADSGASVTYATVKDAIVGLGNPREVGIAVSRQSAFVRAMRVPDVGKDETRQVLQLALGRAFPVAIEDMAFDFRSTSHRSTDGRLVVVGAVKADTLRKITQEVREAGSKVAWVTPTACGAAHVAEEAGFQDAVVLEAFNGSLGLDVVRGGVVRYSRVTHRPSSAEGIAAEVDRTCATAECSPSDVVCVNGSLDLPNKASAKGSALESLAAFPELRMHIELPEESAGRKDRKVRTRMRLALVIWAAALCLATVTYLDRSHAMALASAGQSVWTNEQKKAKSNKDAKDNEVKALEDTKAVLTKAFQPAQTPGDVLVLVSNAVPEGIWLTGLTFERGKPLLLRGTAMENEPVAKFVISLAASDRLRDVKLVFANDGQIERQRVVNFSVSAHVVGNLPIVQQKTKGAPK